MKKKIGLSILGIIICASVGLGVFSIYATNKYKATIPEVLKLYTKEDSKEAKQNTPTPADNKILTDIKDVSAPMMLLLYKVNCPYCEALHPVLEENIKNIDDTNIKNNIVYVNVESPVGKQIVEKYDVDVAATIITIDKDGNNINYTPANKVNNQFVVDEDYTNSIFETYKTEFSR